MDVGTSLVKSVASNGAAEIAADIAELALDANLLDGMLKEVPVFGWFIRAYGVVGAVRDRIFLKKIAKFITGATPDHEMSEELQEQISDPEYCRKVGEDLILLLDRQDHFDKAYLLGKAFKGFLQGMIDYNMFLKVASTIDRAFITDLKNLPTYYDQLKCYDPHSGQSFTEILDDETSQALYRSGLADVANCYVEEICYPNSVGSYLIDLMQ